MAASFAPAPVSRRPSTTQQQLERYAPVARYLNLLLLACCLLLALDWALPMRRYANEPVLRRDIVLTSSSASDPRMAYDIVTPHAAFRLPSEQGARVRDEHRITVWTTPLLGVTRQVSSPASEQGAAPFQPADGNIYRGFAVVPLLLLGVALVGVWPRRSAELRVNAAITGVLLALVALGVLLWA